MLKKLKVDSYFTKLVALFISIIIISMVIMGLLLNRSLQQFRKNCSINIQNARNAMDLLVADMNLNANSMLDSADFSTNKIVTKYGSFLAIARTLTHYVSCTDLVCNAFYINSDTQTVYSTTKPYLFEEFSLFNNGYNILPTDYADFFLRDQSSFWIGARKMTSDEPPVITYVVTYTLHADTPEYALVMHVDTIKLQSLLDNYLPTPHAMIMMLDSDKNELYTVGPTPDDGLLSAFSALGYSNAIPQKMTDHNQTYEVYANESEESAISYVLVVPQNDVWSAIRIDQILVVPLSIIMILATFFLWMVFRYANSAKRQMPGRIALKMYNGCYVDEKELLDDLRQMGVIKPQEWFQAFAFKIVDGTQAHVGASLAIIKGSYKQLENEKILFFSNAIEDTLFFVLNARQDKVSHGAELMMQLKADISQKLQENVALGIGTPVKITQIARTVNEAKIALNHRFVKGENAVIHFETLECPVSNPAYPSDKIKQYYNALLMRQKEPVELSLNNLMSVISSSNNLFFSTCIMYDIVNTTFKAIEELKCPKYIFDNIALQNISSFSSVQEIKCALDTLIQDVFLAFREEDTDLREEISGDRSVQFQRIKEYIQQHFSEADFSVKAIAAEFDMSVSNLSHFFKKQQSENISDYILQLRIHKSKQLIRMTDQTFQDISLACGYANISTFLRQFKQSEQMTPSQYRAIHRKTPMQTIEE